MWRQLGRIRVRLLVVNLIVLLVPVAGLEFARIYERQLLGGLERDMRDQGALVRSTIETAIDEGLALEDRRFTRILAAAARTTRTRIRIVNASGEVVIDSHANGPPEGPEPPAPTLLPGQPLRDRAAARRAGVGRPRRDVVGAFAAHRDMASGR